MGTDRMLELTVESFYASLLVLMLFFWFWLIFRKDGPFSEFLTKARVRVRDRNSRASFQEETPQDKPTQEGTVLLDLMFWGIAILLISMIIAGYLLFLS